MPAKRRSPLNPETIGSNLSEAIEELSKLCGRAARKTLKEEQLQVGLLHAYFHLNFAWNTRRVPTSKYGKMTQAQFKRWGKYPQKIENL